ncbi:TPA: hypothetical protein ACSVSG_000818 [Clostridioides difficile]
MTFKELVNKVRNLVLEAKKVTIEDTENKFTSENVEGALKECIDRADEAFQEADSGKVLLSTAIGSPATSEQTFQEYADYITGFKGTISTLREQLKGRLLLYEKSYQYTTRYDFPGISEGGYRSDNINSYFMIPFTPRFIFIISTEPRGLEGSEKNFQVSLLYDKNVHGNYRTGDTSTEIGNVSISSSINNRRYCSIFFSNKPESAGKTMIHLHCDESSTYTYTTIINIYAFG